MNSDELEELADCARQALDTPTRLMTVVATEILELVHVIRMQELSIKAADDVQDHLRREIDLLVGGVEK